MKYVKIIVLLYTCIQMSNCNAKMDTSKKTEEVSAVGSLDNGSLNKATFLRAIASVKNGSLLDSTVLIHVLPEHLIDLNRVSVDSKISDQQGASFATTGATYKNDDKTLHITITDVGTDSTTIQKLATWSSMQFTNERGDGYEKSYVLNGNKINEKYTTATHTANLTVIYDNRILLDLFGTNFTMEQLLSTIR